jgi:hypothetical protein
MVASPAIQEAENMLKQAHNISVGDLGYTSDSGKVEKKTMSATDTLNKTTKSTYKSNVMKRFGTPSKLTLEQLINISQSSIKGAEDEMAKKRDCEMLETIAEKDFEEKDDFLVKWNRFVNLIDRALIDRSSK